MEDKYRCKQTVIHPETVELVKERLPKDNTMMRLSHFFKMFSDSTRIKIVYSLSVAELCVCDLAEIIDMSQSAVSHQLRSLKDTGLVKYRREGKNIYYSLDDQHVQEIINQGLEHILHLND